MSKHRTLRTVWDQSSSDSRRTSTDVKPRFSTTNSDFQLRFSKTNFHFQTPILKNKLPFSKTYSHFQKQTPLFKLPIFENKLQFFKANFDFPIQFFEIILIIIVLSFTNRLSLTSLYLSLKTSFVYSNLFSLAKTVTIRCYIQTGKRVRSPSSACKKCSSSLQHQKQKIIFLHYK